MRKLIAAACLVSFLLMHASGAQAIEPILPVHLEVGDTLLDVGFAMTGETTRSPIRHQGRTLVGTRRAERTGATLTIERELKAFHLSVSVPVSAVHTSTWALDPSLGRAILSGDGGVDNGNVSVQGRFTLPGGEWARTLSVEASAPLFDAADSLDAPGGAYWSEALSLRYSKISPPLFVFISPAITFRQSAGVPTRVDAAIQGGIMQVANAYWSAGMIARYSSPIGGPGPAWAPTGEVTLKPLVVYQPAEGPALTAHVRVGYAPGRWQIGAGVMWTYRSL